MKRKKKCTKWTEIDIGNLVKYGSESQGRTGVSKGNETEIDGKKEEIN